MNPSEPVVANLAGRPIWHAYRELAIFQNVVTARRGILGFGNLEAATKFCEPRQD